MNADEHRDLHKLLELLERAKRGELENDPLSVRIHTYAQSSLVRGAIENGARAVWLLGPATRLIRVKRRLSLEAMKSATPTGSASSQGHRGGARRTSGCSSCGS